MALSLLGLFSINATKTYVHLRPGIHVETYQDTATFLRTHAQPNEIIVHTEWEDFPILFYHNASLRYLSGLDPTFFYKANPDRYTQWSTIMNAPTSEPLAAKIRDLFDASYLVVSPRRSEFIRALRADPDIVEQHKGRDLLVFSIQPQ